MDGRDGRRAAHQGPVRRGRQDQQQVRRAAEGGAPTSCSTASWTSWRTALETAARRRTEESEERVRSFDERRMVHTTITSRRTRCCKFWWSCWPCWWSCTAAGRSAGRRGIDPTCKGRCWRRPCTGWRRPGPSPNSGGWRRSAATTCGSRRTTWRGSAWPRPAARPGAAPPPVAVRGGWMRRWTTAGRMKRLWRLAYGPPVRVPLGEWRRLLREVQTLKGAFADGTVQWQ